MNIQGTNCFLEDCKYESILEAGLSSQFLELVNALCDEICILHEITDMKLAVKNDEELNGFLLDLSVLLSELECPLESITCGSLETRFHSHCNRKNLIEYLMSEVRTARLSAYSKLNQPSTSSDSKDETWIEVKACLNTLAVPKPPCLPDARDIIRSITSAAIVRLESCYECPIPILTIPIDLRTSKAILELVKTFNQDCRARNLLFLKRIDVTINSFLWSERIKVFETDILKLFAERRSSLTNSYIPGVSDLLAATQYITVIEQASSAERRTHTRTLVHPLAKSVTPSDRGGRTDPQYFSRKLNDSFARRNK